MDRNIHFADDLEKKVAEILDSIQIEYVHESEIKHKPILDFYLPKYDIYIEVKKFYSERAIRQLSGKDNVILIQGIESVKFIQQLLINIEK